MSIKCFPPFLLIFLWSCSNQPSTSTGSTTAMKFGAEGTKQNPTVVENGTLDTLETVSTKVNKTGTYTYSYDSSYIVRHKYVKPGAPPVEPPPTTGTRANLILENNFDDGRLTGFTLANGQFCCSYSLAVTNAPDGIGKAVRYELRRTDADVSGSKRSEMQLAGTDAPQESERWYGYKYWFDTYDVDNGGAESILQFHDGDNTTPPLSIQVSGGRMNLTQSFKNTGNTHDDIGLLETKKWVKIVLHVKWTTSNSGIVQVWKDGKLVVNKSGVRTNSNGGSYGKFFLNKWSWQAASLSSSISTPRIFFVDDFRYGNEKSTYNDVAP